MDATRREALLGEYGEVCNHFRLLTDIRFKLLGFLPLAAAAAAALKKETAGIPELSVSLFGLFVTIGVAIYNARNDQLYDALVGRAASIERSLGLADGEFAARPTAWLVLRLLGRDWKIDHGTAIRTIYGASIGLWLFGALAAVLEVGRRAYVAWGLPILTVKDPSIGVNVLALGLAGLVTYLGDRTIRVQRKRREEEMRLHAQRAARTAEGLTWSQAAANEELLRLCAVLSGEKLDRLQARARFYARVDSDSLSYYMPAGGAEVTACQVVALLTDLPPQWIFDCLTNRRGALGHA